MFLDREGNIPGRRQPTGGAGGAGVPAGKDPQYVNPANMAGLKTGGVGGGNYTPPPFRGPMSPEYDFPDLPLFEAPDFEVPGAAGLYSDPGYQFRRDEGLGALDASAAARGVLRSGGTLTDIARWASDFASQEYSNVFDRALQAYDRAYRGALDEYSPRLRQYELLFGAEQSRATAAWQRAWDEYRARLDDIFRHEQAVIDAATG